MTFDRQQPSVDLRAFLDPLKPGDYFDCGEARLFGIDEALEAEALRRGRAVGDDDFQLVATDGGLIFCRASIMFAIAARWKDLTIGRPEEGNLEGEAILPISWPTHGDLQFTVSRRLGTNIFRRWLQLQAQATRRSQVEQDVRYERTRASIAEPVNGNGSGHTNGALASEQPEPGDGSFPFGDQDSIDPGDNADGGDGSEPPDPHNGANGSEPAGVTIRFDDSDREAIEYATDQEQRRRRRFFPDEEDDPNSDGRSGPIVDPLATLDAAVVDEWVDDRLAKASMAGPGDRHNRDEDPTANPYGDPNGHVGQVGDIASADEAPAPEIGTHGGTAAGGDAGATRFMDRTVDGTDIFPGNAATRNAEGFGRSAVDEARSGGVVEVRPLSGRPGVPVPEINGARLQSVYPGGEPVTGPKLDIRSTLLAGRGESEWVEVLRQRRVFILGLVTILGLILIAVIGFLAGGDDSDGGEAAGDAGSAEVQAGDGNVADGGVDTPDRSTGSSSTTIDAGTAVAGPATAESTAPTLRVSSTSVQICHSNYGGCVPVAADVDCEGDGDGPAFQDSPVAVFGDDVYDLDTDDDREACEPDQPRAIAVDTGG